MKIKAIKVRAFTLIECLVALLVISGSVLIISGLTKLIHQQIISIEQDSIKDWQIFSEQLRTELEGTKLEKVEADFLYVMKKEKIARFGLLGENFRKTGEKGQGYQPMLHKIKAVNMSENNQLVTIKIDFEKGGERTFLYKFSEKNK